MSRNNDEVTLKVQAAEGGWIVRKFDSNYSSTPDRTAVAVDLESLGGAVTKLMVEEEPETAPAS